MKTMLNAKIGSYPNLDFLRACAVLFVLFDHTLQRVGVHSIGKTDLNWLGRLGVLFFFVHTCCVLMMSIERHTGRGLFRKFYIRRAFRIYPLCIVAVFAAMIPPRAPHLTPIEWVSNLALAQNLTFSRNAFGSLWSLPLEVQMYVFLPFIFLLINRFRSLVTAFLLFLVSIPVALWQPHHLARGSVLAFIPAFMPGVIAYWLFRNSKQILPMWSLPLAIALITSAFLWHPNWRLSAWCACLALGLLVPLFGQISSRNLNTASFHIAQYSYGIYLSHVLLLTWLQPTWKSLPLYFLAVAAISVASFHLVELPMIRYGQRLAGYSVTLKKSVAVGA